MEEGVIVLPAAHAKLWGVYRYPGTAERMLPLFATCRSRKWDYDTNAEDMSAPGQ